MTREDIDALPAVAGVYEIVHVSGKRYVGSSRSIRGRCRIHLKELHRGVHHCRHLRHAWKKHGQDQFSFRFIEACFDNPVVLVAREQVWIDKHRRHLYNSKKFAESFSTEWWKTEEGIAARKAVRLRILAWWDEQPEVEKTCEFCGEVFRTRNACKPTRFCSKNCIQKHRNRTGRDLRPHTCVICGKQFAAQMNRGIRTCSPSCTRAFKSPLPADAISAIMERVAGGESMDRIAKDYGVEGSTIQSIAKRSTWADIEIPPEVEEALIRRFATKGWYPRGGFKLTDAQVLEIKRLIAAGAVQSAVARKFGISPQMLNGIKKGQCYAHVRIEDCDDAGIPSIEQYRSKFESDEFKEGKRRRTIEWWANREATEFTCVVCGEAFTARHPMGAKYCPDECYRQEAKETSKFKEKRSCPQCGKEFVTHRRGDANHCCSSACGKKHNSVFSPVIVRGILRRVASGESMRAIARELEVDQTSIQNICKRKVWSEVAIEPEIDEALRARFATKNAHPSSRKLTAQQVGEIKRRLASGPVHQSNLAKEFGVSPVMICGIKKGRLYTEVPAAPASFPLFPDPD